MSSEVVEIKNQFAEIQKKYQMYLPKVDPALIYDLLLRQMEHPDVTPMYMMEVFTKPGLNTEEVRSYIIQKTGMSPAIYDNGTHYGTNQKLTLEILKEISDSDDVLEVTGEYTGGLGSYGVSHERGIHERRRYVPPPAPTSDKPKQSMKPEAQALSKIPQERKRSDYRMTAYIAAGIVGAIAVAGFIISGGLLPNANVGQQVPAGTEPGALHGYVGGPTGLPAVGATVLATQQGNDFFASAFVSINGQYVLDLPPGNYIVYVAYPDGTDKISTIDIQRGSSHDLNFAY
jgi:hypothetical protein